MNNQLMMGQDLKGSRRIRSLLKYGLKQCVRNMQLMLGSGIITAGLLGVMTVLIAEEFKPQDRIELSAFDINYEPDDLIVLIDRSPPKPLQQIEVPPPPPDVDVPTTNRPNEPITETSVPQDIFDPDKFRIPTGYTIIEANRNPEPILRVQPMMPARADRSGHCRMSFDIGPDGKPYNITASYCSQNHFQRPATRSVAKWIYRPEIRDGLPVTRTGLETMIRFNLSDENGNIIPE